jgi:hypothetical protein
MEKMKTGNAPAVEKFICRNITEKGVNDEIIKDRHFVFKYFDFCVRQSGSRRAKE